MSIQRTFSTSLARFNMSQFKSHVINTKLTKHFIASVPIRHYENNCFGVETIQATLQNTCSIPQCGKGKQWHHDHKHHALGLSSKWESFIFFVLVPERTPSKRIICYWDFKYISHTHTLLLYDFRKVTRKLSSVGCR